MIILILLWSVHSSDFLRLSPGVSSQGLGGAMTTIDEGLSAFHNPSCAGDTKINFTLARWFVSTTLLTLGLSTEDFCLGVNYLNYGSIRGFDELGNETGNFVPYDLRCAIGRRFGRLGLGLEFFQTRIADYSLWGICGNVSSCIEFDRIRFGLKLEGMGRGFNESTTIPWYGAAGIRVRLADDLDILLEAKAPNPEACLGGLYRYQAVSILTGIRYLRPRGSNAVGSFFSDLQFSTGVTIAVEEYEVGYSLVYTEFSMVHQFAITFRP